MCNVIIIIIIIIIILKIQGATVAPPPPLFYVSAKLGLSCLVEHGLRVWENRMLRKIFEPEEEDVAEYLRKLRNEELHGLCSPITLRVIKSRGMRWARHVACMDES